MEEFDDEEDYEPKLMLEDGSDMSEEEDDDLEKKHASLMASIKAMTQTDQKKVIERTIGSADVSEFGFNKMGGSKINIGDLISTLNTSNQAGKLKKQVKSIGNEKVADIPLEKPQQERLVRGIAYKAITEEVTKWQPLIQKNRKAEQLTFPLQQPNYSLKTSDEMTKRFQPRTPLEREIALLLHGSDNVESQTKMLTKAEERALKAMSLEEAKERRAELMKFRALMTYSETRFRRQKKIKSKGFRKILRKEKMKKEEKELDSLQKTDPEKYLEKIEYADKARVEERMSLKHRGGSKFARKKMMYARYDPLARQAVQDMISKNKELTKKEYVSDESDGNISMDEDQQLNMISATLDSDNPWMKAPSKTSEFVRPKQISHKVTNDKDQLDSESEDEILTFKNSSSEVNLLELEAQRRQKLKRKHDKIEVFDLSNVNMDENKDSDKEMNSENEELEKRLTESMKEENTESSKKKKKKKTPKKQTKEDNQQSNEVNKSDITEEKQDIEELFNILENTEKLKKNKKLTKKQKKQLKKTENEGQKIEKDNEEVNDEAISMSTTRKTTMEDMDGHWSDDDKAGVTTQKEEKVRIENIKNKDKNMSVDPKKLFTIQPDIIKTKETSEIVTNEDDDDIIDDEQRMTIAEAFADDDVIEEFTLEKKDIIDESKPKDIDLVLPGWGDWGGEGLQVSKKKKKKYTIKKKALHRKDSKMGNVILNEKKDTAVAEHQVKDLPRQFLNVKQFEQSISQPIGNTWNPEKAFHRMIQPKVVTQAGAIIKPIDKEEMFKKQKIDKKAGGDKDKKREVKKGVVKGKSRSIKASRKKH